MYLLQADLSWLSGRTGADFLIGCLTAVAMISCWKVIPLFLHEKSKKELAEIEAKKEAVMEENNSLIRSTSSRLGNIEASLLVNAQNTQSMQAEITAKFDTLGCESKEMKRILFEVSCDTQYSILCNEKADIYERLKAFRNLIAFGKNGGIKESGFSLVLQNKKEWRQVEKQELKIKIVDQGYWDKTMEQIRKSIFDW